MTCQNCKDYEKALLDQRIEGAKEVFQWQKRYLIAQKEANELRKALQEARRDVFRGFQRESVLDAQKRRLGAVSEANKRLAEPDNPC